MKPSFAILLISALLLAACGGESPRRAAAPASAAPIAVQAAAARMTELPGGYEATGAVRARSQAAISAKVMGYVLSVTAQAGDRVQAGQTLVTIDARDLDTGLRRAEAGRAEVASAISEADNGVNAARANLDLAQATFKRMESLAEKKSVSAQELDEASARLKAAQANYEMARSRRQQLDSRAAQADQEVRAAAITRDYSKVLAPFSGVVSARMVEPGAMAAPGAPLLTLEQDGALRLEAQVDEARLPGVKPGQPVEVTLDALQKTLKARVTEVSPTVDAASRSYIVKIDLPAAPGLRAGAFGRALFPTAVRKALAVPASALVERGQMQSVFVVEGNLARLRVVTAGARANGTVEILSGLSEGERVVAPAPASLVDGATVEVRP